MKNIKPIAITVIILILLRNPIMRIFHLDYANIEVASIYRLIFALIFLSCIGIIVSQNWKKDFTKWKKTWTMGLMLFLGWIFISYFSVFMRHYEPITTEPLYQHKTSEKQIRYFLEAFKDSDGTISSEMVIAQPIGKHFIYYKQMNLIEDDMNEYELILKNKN
jgi:hypothetical protein